MQEPRLRGAAIFLALIAISSLVRPPLCAAEPEFQGKPAAKWLDLLTSHDDADRELAIKAIAADPQGAKPVLDDFVRQLSDRHEIHRVKPALDEFVRRLGNRNEIDQVLLRWALAEVGPAAVPSLMDGRLSRNAVIRRASFGVLQSMGKPPAKVAYELLRLLPTLTDELQEKTMIAIGDFGPPAIPALIEMTRYCGPRESRVRAVAIRFLREHAGHSKAVVDAFVERLRDADPTVRWGAAEALGLALPSERTAVANALRAVAAADSESNVRSAALNSLTRLGFHDVAEKSAEPNLRRISGEVNAFDIRTVRQTIIDARKNESAASKATQMLTAKLSDPDFATRSLAAVALALITHRDESLGVIARGVKQGETLGAKVIELLSECGPVAVPLLLNARRDETNEYIRTDLARAVDKVAIRPGDLPSLRKLLADDAPEVRAWALNNLIQIKDRSPEMLTALARQMADTNRETRDRAALTMMDLGQAALPALIEVSQDKNPLVRRQAVFVITVIGQPSSDAVDALVRALDDEDEMVRFWACISLGRVKDQQMRLAPLLTARQTDSSEKVRAVARNAFQQLTLTEVDR